MAFVVVILALSLFVAAIAMDILGLSLWRNCAVRVFCGAYCIYVIQKNQSTIPISAYRFLSGLSFVRHGQAHIHHIEVNSMANRFIIMPML